MTVPARYPTAQTGIKVVIFPIFSAQSPLLRRPDLLLNSLGERGGKQGKENYSLCVGTGQGVLQHNLGKPTVTFESSLMLDHQQSCKYFLPTGLILEIKMGLKSVQFNQFQWDFISALSLYSTTESVTGLI